MNRVWLNVSKSRDDESCLAIVWSRSVQVAFHSQLRQKRSGSTASRHATKPNAPPISITRGGIGFLEGGDVHTGGRGRERYIVDGNRESGGQFFFIIIYYASLSVEGIFFRLFKISVRRFYRRKFLGTPMFFRCLFLRARCTESLQTSFLRLELIFFSRVKVDVSV